MSVKKLSYYLQDADITLRSDHLPLKKFLSKNTLNTKVNNWAIEISPYRIQFEYIKGIKSTLADTMSRLIKITPEIELEPEPTGQEYGYEVFEELQPIETTTCHIDKYSQGHFSAPMAPMEFISMDLIGDFIPSSQGSKYALTVICMLTGYTFCIPIPSKRASDVITAYVDNVYAKFGGSKKILSDNGTEFKNQLFEKVAKELGVEFKCYTAPYHPQSNGRIEGFHHFLKACMSKHISKTMEWDEVVHLATAAYNFFPNEHSRESPFFLMFGRNPRIPLNTLLEPKIRYMGTEENILSLEALQRIYFMVAENLKLARERQTKQKLYHPIKLNTEDMVMIKTHADGQFQPIYKGYYRIVSFKGNQVQVIPCEGGKPHFVHITDVKYVLPVDNIISHIPTFNQFGRKTKLNLNPNEVPDLKWKLSNTLNTKTSIIPIKIEKVNTQTTQLTLK